MEWGCSLRAFESSITRLMMVVATAAVGMTTLKSQSDFWLGALTVLTSGWLLMAAGMVTVEHGRRRSFWLAFLLSAVATLAVGFGTWSDSALRSTVFSDPTFVQKHFDDLLPTTKAMLHLNQYVGSRPRATIETFNRSGDALNKIVVTSSRYNAGDVEQTMIALENAIKEDVAFFSTFQPRSAARFLAINPNIDIYFNAFYMLLSLMLGGVTGACVSAVWSIRWIRRTSADLPVAENSA